MDLMLGSIDTKLVGSGFVILILSLMKWELIIIIIIIRGLAYTSSLIESSANDGLYSLLRRRISAENSSDAVGTKAPRQVWSTNT